jgi:hypothetical protein
MLFSLARVALRQRFGLRISHALAVVGARLPSPLELGKERIDRIDLA